MTVRCSFQAIGFLTASAMFDLLRHLFCRLWAFSYKISQPSCTEKHREISGNAILQMLMVKKYKDMLNGKASVF
jgi:hypothetical protein